MEERASELAVEIWELLRGQLVAPATSIAAPLYWMHLATALLLALLVHIASRRGGWRAFRREHLSSRVWWHASARADYGFYLVNGVVFPLLVAPHLLEDLPVRAWVDGRLVAVLGSHGEAAPGPAAAVVLGAALFVAYDLGRWIGHLAMHRVPLLWAFHKVHHSAEVLTPVTTFRVHPVELAVMAAATTMTTGVFAGAVMYAYPADGVFASLSLVAAVGLFVLDLGGSLLRHSSAWLSYGPVIERVLVSPAQHQIHHSVAPRHLDKNFGFALAIWDALAGTLYVPVERERLTVGLADGTAPEYRSVLRLYAMPILDVAQRFLRLAPRRAAPHAEQ